MAMPTTSFHASSETYYHFEPESIAMQLQRQLEKVTSPIRHIEMREETFKKLSLELEQTLHMMTTPGSPPKFNGCPIIVKG